jgi:dTDP-4-dehydrorhamnose 3,5-epimerase
MMLFSVSPMKRARLSVAMQIESLAIRSLLVFRHPNRAPSKLREDAHQVVRRMNNRGEWRTDGDLKVIALKGHADSRGELKEVWRRSSVPLAAAQLTVTRSEPGVLRGMHLHLRQTDVWFVAQGRGFIATVDVRKHPLAVRCFELDSTSVVVIPPGIGHGLYSIDATTLIYLLDAEYTGDDEYAFRWDDEDVAIPWPSRQVTLSIRDRSAPSLAELLKQLASGLS